MKYIPFLIILLFVCSCSTMSSIANEPGYKTDAKVYAGTRNDLSGIKYLFSNEPAWGILALGELPFCLAADTILLPFTIYLDSQDKTKESKEE